MKSKLFAGLLVATAFLPLPAQPASSAGNRARQSALRAAGRSRPSPKPTRSPRRWRSMRSMPPAASTARSSSIVSFDTAGKPDQAVVGVRKLAEDDKVMAIIGPFSSSECRVAFPAGRARRRAR